MNVIFEGGDSRNNPKGKIAIYALDPNVNLRYDKIWYRSIRLDELLSNTMLRIFLACLVVSKSQTKINVKFI